MSGNSNVQASASESTNALAEMWANLFEQSNQQAKSMLDLMKVSSDPQEIQRRWLDAMGQSLDSFMRTPAFLESMQRNLKSMTDLKGVQDRFIQDAARQVGMPLATDITGLFERLHSVEQSILNRLKAIDTRLKAIESKLDVSSTSNISK